MRESTRGRYTRKDIYEGLAFRKQVKERDRNIFRDWVGGMNGGQLAKKYYLAEITVRQHLTRMKRIYEDIQRRSA